MNAGPGDKKTDEEEEAALDVAEGNVQKKGVSVLSWFLHQFMYDMSYFKWIHILTFVLNNFIYKMNSYILPTVKVGDTIENYAPEAVVGDHFNIHQGMVTIILPNDSLQVMADVHFYVDGLIPITYGQPIWFEGGEWFYSDNCNCIVGDDKGATICRILGQILDIKKRAKEEFIASNQSKKLVNVTLHLLI